MPPPPWRGLPMAVARGAHLDVVALADAVGAVLRLHVVAGVPVGVEDEDGGGAHQVEAEAARLGGEEEDELLVDRVEIVDQLAALRGGRAAIEA